MTLNELSNVEQIINSLTNNNQKYKGSVSYKLMCLIANINDCKENYDKEVVKIIKKYGIVKEVKDNKTNIDDILSFDELKDYFELDEKGNFKIQEDKIDDCNKEIESLGKTNVDFNSFKLKDCILTIEDLNELKLTVNEVFIIRDFIDIKI